MGQLSMFGQWPILLNREEPEQIIEVSWMKSANDFSAIKSNIETNGILQQPY
jgi:hypothetical protein